MKETIRDNIMNEPEVLQAVVKSDLTYNDHDNKEVTVPAGTTVYVDFRDNGEIFALFNDSAFQIYSDEFWTIQ